KVFVAERGEPRQVTLPGTSEPSTFQVRGPGPGRDRDAAPGAPLPGRGRGAVPLAWLPLIDLSSLPDAVRGVEAPRLALAEAGAPFDLGRGPLLRAQVARLGDGDHVVSLTLHHIVSDGWSLGVLLREVTLLYGAALARLPSPLPPLPVQYADYAVW